MFNVKRPGGYSLALAAVLLAISAASYGPAAILQAIIPASVPAANKQGSTGTKFLIANGSFTNGNLHATDANGNAVDFGAGTLGTINGQNLTFGGGLTLPAGANTSGGLVASQYAFNSLLTAGPTDLFNTFVAGSRTLAAGIMNVLGATTRIQGWGTFQSNAAGTTLTVGIAMGATTLAQQGFAFPATAVSYQFFFDSIITTYQTGTTGTVFTSYISRYSNLLNGTEIAADYDSGSQTTKDLTVAQILHVNVSQTNPGNYTIKNLIVTNF